ncbi:MAG: ABC transporter permease [Dehalococcoidia bacterium]|nr:ABC transporter permease [Dehalococcoidia bacterium]
MSIALPVAPTSTADLGLRSGPSYWFQSYVLMMRWEVLSLRLFLPIMAAVQLLIGGGIVIGFGFLFEEISVPQATYLAVGGAVMPLLTLGLVMIPQQVAEQKLMGTYAFLFSLPVPRMAMYFAGLTVFSVIALPPAGAALAIAAWRYDLALSFSPLAVPAALLVVSVASAVGYAIGHAVPQPRVTQLITQLLIFVVAIFSPINFPSERFPQWLQALHHVLPMEHSAIVMRSTLTDGLVTGAVWPSWLVLGAWVLGSLLVTYRVISRRG